MFSKHYPTSQPFTFFHTAPQRKISVQADKLHDQSWTGLSLALASIVSAILLQKELNYALHLSWMKGDYSVKQHQRGFAQTQHSNTNNIEYKLLWWVKFPRMRLLKWLKWTSSLEMYQNSNFHFREILWFWNLFSFQIRTKPTKFRNVPWNNIFKTISLGSVKVFCADTKKKMFHLVLSFAFYNIKYTI